KPFFLYIPYNAPHFGKTDPAPRPSPAPPVQARPDTLALTSIKTLVRDPYAIYAQHVLGLRPLESLAKSPDARLRGIAIHTIFERFIRDAKDDLTADRLLGIAREVLRKDVDWPSARLLWAARIERIAEAFLEQENARQAKARPAMFEQSGAVTIPDIGFTIKAQADRIDMDDRGGAYLYDYKTGAIPTAQQQFNFDMQLLLLSAMALKGAFKPLLPRHVEEAVYLGVGSKLRNVPAPLEDKPPMAAWADLVALIGQYLDPNKGFTARRAMEKRDDVGYFDHLSRFGEWDETTQPKAGKVGL
ncbi:MAG: PD-(D/E)XK nuclease family protein, partial [Pseudomonadota bacterium]